MKQEKKTRDISQDAPNTKAMGSGQNAVDSKNFKSGAYSTFLVLIVLALVIVINLVAGKLNLRFDISKNSLFTLTDTTKEILENLQDPITIYYIAQEGQEADTILKIVDKYDQASKQITLVEKDPVLYPNFTKDYTDEAVSSDSVILVNETTKAYRYIDYQDMMVYSQSSSSEVKATGVDVEGQITAGIQRITSTDVPTVYYTGGHGETALGDTITSAIGKQNVNLQSLNMYSTSQIPEDCQVLIINGPTYDISKEEKTTLENYLEQGGKIILLLANTEEETPNLNDLLGYYGMERHQGVIVESQEYCLGTYQTYLLPKVGYHESIMRTFSAGDTMLMPFSQGITELPSPRSSLKVTKLLYSSDDAYLKRNTQADTVEKEEGDLDGPFDLGVYSTLTLPEGGTADLMVLSSAYFINETVLSSGQYGNTGFFTEALSYMTGGSAGLSIPTRSLEQQYVVTSQKQITTWAIITVGVIPLLVLLAGFVVWIRRRRR